LHLTLRSAANIGRGAGPVNHMALLEQYRAAPEVLDRLQRFGERLAGLEGVCRAVPRSGSEAVLALPHADAAGEMAGFRGRMACAPDGRLVVPCRGVLGGAPEASVVLAAARRRRVGMNCTVSLAGTQAVRKAMARVGWKLREFDWGEAASGVPPRTDEILANGAARALDAPLEGAGWTAVGHGGAHGVEPRLYALGRDEDDLLEGLSRLFDALA
jgi:predicted fused transcriptional regulator/phosphomethylpyrimidine kinase